nr:MAG TPA: hypothetical protein [Caudoviricetes sp.]
MLKKAVKRKSELVTRVNLYSCTILANRVIIFI